MPTPKRALRGAALLSLLPGLALAQTTLPAIEVEGRAAGSLTAPPVEAQRRALEQAPAATRFVDSEEFQNRYAATLREVLAETPGVFVQSRYGQELRLSLRGSGIARGFHLRGVEVLQDGIPVNFADGSGDFYQIDPLALRSAAVYPGGNALRFGSSSLGGAVDFTTPTAHTAEAPNILRAEGGTFGTWRLSGQASRIFGDWDVLGTGTVMHQDGWRQHSRSQYEQFNANLGYRISNNVETRFYAGAYIVRQQLPGSLSLSDALNRPRSASAAALSGNQARNVWAERFANRTTVRLAAGQLDVDSWLTHKRLYHPIFQVIDQDGLTWGVAPRFSTEFQLGGLRSELVLGARYFAGSNDALQYLNNRGSRGALTAKGVQRAENYEIYAENRLWLLSQLALVTGVKALRNDRAYENRLNGQRFSRSYDGLNPRIGLLWEPRPEVQVFTNLTRSQDVPDFSDQLQTVGGAPFWVPLQSQRAWTVEIGTRGRFERGGWDLTLFRSNIRGQLLQFTVDPSIPAGTFNAGSTVNQGVEFAAHVDVARGLLGAEDRLSFGQVWTWNDFRFRGDRQYGGNRIAGLPPHVLRSALTYARPEGSITPILDWVPVGAWADYANTLRTNGYFKLGLEAALNVAPGITLFLDARNLTNKRYVSDLSTLANAAAPGANTAVFYPGEGRSVFLGTRIAF
ncbi:TonB-dependent receptor [Siccirubricoccus sp. KC 17139]|uniref:TonB-dependent receptor n=1 Tax=Siccirubricoccus soli TaxID=2899147 RepID=A0ABT1DBB3_9PROT|nr:TonB-dependent receptor [Siccirubricoccus soli]MCO6418862.1 TonB-dependent receptor [Siccirubricoccus soli]MCP2684997.1 TonB-dependent receptor [Siccirubricoccus soli]